MTSRRRRDRNGRLPRRQRGRRTPRTATNGERYRGHRGTFTSITRRRCQLPLGTTWGRGLLPWQRAVHGFFTWRGVCGRVGGRGRREGLRSPGFGQEDVTPSAGNPLGTTGVVHNGPHLVEGPDEGHPDPRLRQSPLNGPRRCSGRRLVAYSAGGAGGTSSGEKATLRQPRPRDPPPWGLWLRRWWCRRRWRPQ